jgi:GABA(A) receptor-associated protein
MDFQFKKLMPDPTKRLEESIKLREKYPDRIPIICEKDPKSKLAVIDKTKYLAPAELTVSQFVHIVKKKLEISKEQALFLLIGGKNSASGESVLSDIYQQHKDSEDGFLYITYTGDLVWG